MNTRTSELPNLRTLVDPVTIEVIGNTLLAIAEEMGVILIKTSYSTNIKERRDCSAALLDGPGRTIAQAEHVPLHMGSMLGLVAEILKRYPREAIRPGDLFMANDPYSGGGTHLPDITVAAPFFVEGELLAWATNISHHAEVGGSPRAATDIYTEGLRIPPIKVYAAGTLRQDVLDFVLLNFRLPDERLADLQAQFASARAGLQRLAELCQRRGRATVVASLDALYAQAERHFRRGVAAIPDGRYRFTDSMDDDGVSDTPIPIACEIAVEGDDLTCDFTGTGAQVQGPINLPRSATLATVYYAMKAVVDPAIPVNAGFYRAIRVVAPEGCLVSPRPPAACQSRSDTSQRVVDVLFGALAQAVPSQVIAASNGAMTGVHFAGTDSRSARYFVYPETLGGGMGARPTKDGVDGVQVHMTNTSNLPAESLEQEYPILLTAYALVPDSGGAGRYRGGLSLMREYRALADGILYRSKGDRVKSAPWGLAGGRPGASATFTLNPGKPDERRLGSKEFGLTLKAGDVVRVCTAGSGGYGEPRQRPRDAVLRDLLEGKVSAEAARRDYGVTATPAALRELARGKQ